MIDHEQESLEEVHSTSLNLLFWLLTPQQLRVEDLDSRTMTDYKYFN